MGYGRKGKWRSFWQGVVFSSLIVALLVLSQLPARIGQSVYESQFGLNPWAALVIGTAVDLRVLLPFFLLIVTIAFVLLRRQLGRQRKGKSARSIAFALSAFTVGIWLMGLAGAEFKLQRGVLPTFRDLTYGAGDVSSVLSYAPVLVQQPYFWPNFIFVVALSVLIPDYAVLQ